MERAVSLVALFDTKPVQKPPLAKTQITRQDPRRKKHCCQCSHDPLFYPDDTQFPVLL